MALVSIVGVISFTILRKKRRQQSKEAETAEVVEQAPYNDSVFAPYSPRIGSTHSTYGGSKCLNRDVPIHPR